MLNNEALLKGGEKLYSIPQISKLSEFKQVGLNFHRATIWRWVKDGKIPALTINGRHYLRLSDYYSFVRGTDGSNN